MSAVSWKKPVGGYWTVAADSSRGKVVPGSGRRRDDRRHRRLYGLAEAADHGPLARDRPVGAVLDLADPGGV